MRINHLFVNSVDVEKSTRFYCDLLGFVPTKTFNEGLGATFQSMVKPIVTSMF